MCCKIKENITHDEKDKKTRTVLINDCGVIAQQQSNPKSNRTPKLI